MGRGGGACGTSTEATGTLPSRARCSAVISGAPEMAPEISDGLFGSSGSSDEKIEIEKEELEEVSADGVESSEKGDESGEGTTIGVDNTVKADEKPKQQGTIEIALEEDSADGVGSSVNGDESGEGTT